MKKQVNQYWTLGPRPCPTTSVKLLSRLSLSIILMRIFNVQRVAAAMTSRNIPPKSQPAWAAAIGIARRPVPIRSPNTLRSYRSVPLLGGLVKYTRQGELTVWVKVLLPGLYTSTSRPFGPSLSRLFIESSSPSPCRAARSSVAIADCDCDFDNKGVRSDTPLLGFVRVAEDILIVYIVRQVRCTNFAQDVSG